jgi:hypothetical protein
LLGIRCVDGIIRWLFGANVAAPPDATAATLARI